VGVEQQIVKIPEHETIAAFGGSQTIAAGGGVDFEQDLAIQQQCEKFMPWKTVLPPELLDLSRRRQHGESSRNCRIANSKQGTGARRFQHHLIATPSQIRKSRQHDDIGVAERRRLRPIVGNLGLDDDPVLVVIRATEAIFQETAPGQSPDQQIDFLVDAAVRRKRGERQACSKRLRAGRRLGAEFSQTDRIAVEVGDDISVRLRFERDVTDQPGRNGRRSDPPRLLSSFFFSGSAHPACPL